MSEYVRILIYMLEYPEQLTPNEALKLKYYVLRYIDVLVS